MPDPIVSIKRETFQSNQSRRRKGDDDDDAIFVPEVVPLASFLSHSFSRLFVSPRSFSSFYASLNLPPRVRENHYSRTRTVNSNAVIVTLSHKMPSFSLLHAVLTAVCVRVCVGVIN